VAVAERHDLAASCAVVSVSKLRHYSKGRNVSAGACKSPGSAQGKPKGNMGVGGGATPSDSTHRRFSLRLPARERHLHSCFQLPSPAKRHMTNADQIDATSRLALEAPRCVRSLCGGAERPWHFACVDSRRHSGEGAELDANLSEELPIDAVCLLATPLNREHRRLPPRDDHLMLVKPSPDSLRLSWLSRWASCVRTLCSWQQRPGYR